MNRPFPSVFAAVAVLALLFLQAPPALAAAAAIDTPASLRVSADHRRLERADGRPFFWLGDTAWLLLQRLNRAETERYLEDRRRKGFTVIQVMVLHAASDANAYGAKALVDGDPSRPTLTPGRDPARPGAYDYWDHVDWVVDLAVSKGLYLAMVPAWGSLAGDGSLNSRTAGPYATFLAQRYGGRSNVIWLNGGDTRGDEHTDVWRTVGRALKRGDPGALVTFHPFGRRDSSDWFHTDDWLDFNMFQSGHQAYAQDSKGWGEDNWRFVERDLALTPLKPTIDGEPSYEDIPQGLHDLHARRWAAADARRYAYWSVFAGAFGHTYGDNAVMQFWAPGRSPAYGADRPWTTAIDDPGARQLHHLKDLILSRPAEGRRSAQALVVGPGRERYERVAALRGRTWAMAYTYTGRPFTLRLDGLGARGVQAWWFDPRTGAARSAGLFAARGARRFAPPGPAGPGHDWVLVLDDASQGFGRPGRARP